MNNQHFLKGYLSSHFEYKFHVLESLLEKKYIIDIAKYEEENHYTFDEDRFYKSIVLDLKMTYYQVLETLFELLFTLYDKGLKGEQPNFWKDITNSNWRKNYNRISDIAKGSLDIMELNFHFPNFTIDAGRYYFYFGSSDSEQLYQIKQSLEAIKIFIKLCATDFTDRELYNALKHGIRAFPLISNFSMTTKDKNIKLDFPLNYSLTYMERSDSKGLELVTKPFDKERTLTFGKIASKLIWMIIEARKAKLQTNVTRIQSYMFIKEDILSMNIKRDGITKFKLKFE